MAEGGLCFRLGSGPICRAVGQGHWFLYAGDSSRPHQWQCVQSAGINMGPEGREDLAVADNDQAVRLDPSNAMSYNNRGNAWKAKDEYDIAIADFNESIRLDPKSVVAYQNRGSTWEAKGDHDKALADYNEAVRLDPEFAVAYMSRGIVWRHKKEFSRAIAEFDKAPRLDPKLASGALRTGNHLAGNGGR